MLVDFKGNPLRKTGMTWLGINRVRVQIDCLQRPKARHCKTKQHNVHRMGTCLQLSIKWVCVSAVSQGAALLFEGKASKIPAFWVGVKRGNLYPWKERKVLNGVFGEKRKRGFLAMWHLEPSRKFALKENHLHKNAVMQSCAWPHPSKAE